MSFVQSPITCAEFVEALVTTITLDRLRKRGYEALLTYYEKIAPSRLVGKPLYKRPAWFTLSLWSLSLPKGRREQWCERRFQSVLTGGVVSIRRRNLLFSLSDLVLPVYF